MMAAIIAAIIRAINAALGGRRFVARDALFGHTLIWIGAHCMSGGV